MALIDCEECGKQVSHKAVSCPNCGVPIAVQVVPVVKPTNPNAPLNQESIAAALVLTFLLGPFGLCYVNLNMGLILGFTWLATIIFTFGILAIIPRNLGIIFAVIYTDNYNAGRPVMLQNDEGNA